MGSPLPTTTTIRPEDLAIDTSSPLGNRSGSVFPANWHNRVVAVKVLSLSSEVSAELFVSRVGLWQSLSHPHLLQVFGASPPDADTTYIVTPCYQSGNVRQYLARYPNVDRPQLILEVALGMQFLHKRGLVHGSLRPSNILIDDDGKACVSDHGMVDLHIPSNAEAHRYFSPEAWKGTVSAPSDVYAFAMSAVEVFTSSLPWGVLSEKHIYQLVIHEDARPDHPDPDLSIRVGLSSQFWSIIEESWHKEARLRPSFDIIIRLWQATSNDSVSDISSNTRRTGPSSLYAHDPSHVHTLSQMSFSSGPPAYEAEVAEAVPITPAPDSTPGSSRTLRPSAELRHTFSPSQDIYSAVPHSAPISSPSSIARKINEFPSPPSMLPPPRRGVSVPSTPYSPHFRPSTLPTVNETDATSIRAPQPTRTPPSTLVHQSSIQSFGDHRNLTRSPPTSPSISSSSSSNSNRVNYLLPLTPQSTNSTFPAVVNPAANNYSILSAQGSRRLTAMTLRTLQKPSDSDNHSDVLSYYDDLSNALPPTSSTNRAESILDWQANHRRYTSQTADRILPAEDVASIRTGGSGTESNGAKPSPVLLMGALQSEIKEGRDRYIIDEYLVKIQMLAIGSVKDAQRLVTAGAVPTLIHLLRTRAATMEGLEVLLMTLGTLAFDSISANTIYRTNTAGTLIEIFDSATSSETMTLVSWCLNRICRNPEIASGLIKQNLVRLLVQKGLQADHATPSISAYCLGTLAQSDGLAETLADIGVIQALADFLSVASESSDSRVDDVCSALYALARISRSIKLAKTIAKSGCLPLVAHHLCRSEDPQVLNWSARAVGCMMRPNSSDMSKVLLEAGVAAGLARLPSVLPPEEVEPLSSFAFAIQRFSCAEWGSGTRKSLVEAGVVDSLLAALRTAVEEPYPQVHIDLALAVSFLSDVGGAPIRKEIVNAGGIDILRRVGASGSPEVSRACNMAIKSTTGNLWSRNAASAKTAMAHNWNGGCPEYQPTCPLMFSTEPHYY